jgi:small subunit ribosomal protein S9
MTKETEAKYFYGTGRRKTAVARVRLYPGKGQVKINKEEIAEPNSIYLAPLTATSKLNDFDISVVVEGGGFMAQLEAIRHGVSRALISFDPELKPTLRKLGYVTRDPREKERKKPGLKRARRAPQFSKR